MCTACFATVNIAYRWGTGERTGRKGGLRPEEVNGERGPARPVIPGALEQR
jgi:hypothetical protein